MARLKASDDARMDAMKLAKMMPYGSSPEARRTDFEGMCPKEDEEVHGPSKHGGRETQQFKQSHSPGTICVILGWPGLLTH